MNAAELKRSRAEFVADLGVVEEEAEETIFRLELAAAHGSVPHARLQPLIDETGEQTAIFAASRETARVGANRQSPIGIRQ